MFPPRKKLKSHDYRLRSLGPAPASVPEEKKPCVKKFDLVTRICNLNGFTNKALLQFFDLRTLTSVSKTSKNLHTAAAYEMEELFFKILKEFVLHDDLVALKNLEGDSSIIFPAKKEIIELIKNYKESLSIRIQKLLQLIEAPLERYLCHTRHNFHGFDIPESICLLLKPQVQFNRFKPHTAGLLRAIKGQLNFSLYNYIRDNRASHDVSPEKEVQSYFDKGANPNHEEPDHSTYHLTFRLGVLNSPKSIIKVFIAAGANVNYCSYSADNSGGIQHMSILMSAIDRCNLSIVKVLIEAGADVNLKMPSKYKHGSESSALWYALCKGSTADDIAIYLIQCGANLRNLPGGATALHTAASHGCETVVNLLVTQYQDVCPINKRCAQDKKTALERAIENRHPAVVERLLKAGANPELCDKQGNNALDAAKKYKIVRLKIYKEIKPKHKYAYRDDIKAIKEGYDSIAKLLIEHSTPAPSQRREMKR